jgi:hypothetical protein
MNLKAPELHESRVGAITQDRLDSPRPAVPDVELWHVSIGGREWLELRQESLNPNYPMTVKISLDTIEELVSMLGQQITFFKPPATGSFRHPQRKWKDRVRD